MRMRRGCARCRPKQLPSVDVYIPTYNEPLEVLEKTITGALCLDYPNFKVWVLDDGRRPWLKAFCEAKGVGYLTRPDNAHAKAGNINHALTKTNADFVAIFDADFIPQRNFLMRTMGFFADPGIGIVQVPHAFYNYDPTQSSLALQKALPDDQRFFFEAVMPSRDGWDAAFCCGSNSVTRREALAKRSATRCRRNRSPRTCCSASRCCATATSRAIFASGWPSAWRRKASRRSSSSASAGHAARCRSSIWRPARLGAT